jgi:hypothetical protein
MQGYFYGAPGTPEELWGGSHRAPSGPGSAVQAGP